MAGYDFREYEYEDTDDYTRRRCCGCRRRQDIPSTGDRRPKGGKCSDKCLNNIQLLLLLVAVGAGVGLGAALRTIHPFNQPKLHPRPLWYLDFPAELLIRAMTLLAIPLMVSSIVSGVASLGGAGSVGVRALVFYLGTTVLACAEGFTFVLLIRPGADVPLTPINDTRPGVNRVDTALDMLRNLIPDNIIKPAFEVDVTKRDWTYVEIENLNKSVGPIEVLSVGHRDSINILGLTVLSFLVGIAMNSVGPKARPLVDFFTAVFEVVMVIIKAFIWLLPIGVVFMVAGTVVRLEEPLTYLQSMMWFLVTVLSGLATHFLLVMPVLLVLLTRTNPFRHLFRMARALCTALATSNSNITLPVTMQCLEQEGGYDGRVVRFMCPIGATVNMDGTCLYEAIAVIFIATLRGVATGPVQVITAGITAIMIPIGASAASSTIVLWGLLLESVGLPFQDVFLLIPFDWLLGRLRTAVNVWGDSIGVVVVCHHSRNVLQRLPYDVTSAVDAEYEDDVSERDVGMVMNGSYTPIGSNPSRRKSYTLTVENECGDIVKVSKV